LYEIMQRGDVIGCKHPYNEVQRSSLWSTRLKHSQVGRGGTPTVKREGISD